MYAKKLVIQICKKQKPFHFFKSELFNALREVNNEWAKNPDDPKTVQFDQIAYDIELSSENNRNELSKHALRRTCNGNCKGT